MIFGSVINEDLKDEIVVTVIATGFDEAAVQPKKTRPSFGQAKPNISHQEKAPAREVKKEEPREPVQSSQSVEDTLDIPTFLRNRNRRR